MNLPVVFRRAAAEEFVEARDWYEAQRPGLGEEFVASIDAAIASMTSSPRHHAKVHGEIRRVLVRRFPYGVFYVVDGGTVVVLAVFHCARNPRVWQRR